MKKRVLSIAVLAVLLCALLAPVTSFASGAGVYPSGTYQYFESYDVKINVQGNNVLDITETIVADYGNPYVSPSHGIIREIPVSLDFTFPDGSTKTFRPIVSNVKVNMQYSRSSDSNYLYLKIGDPNRYASGKVTYVISYTYDIGYDYYKEGDFLYFNVIGTDWNADIKTATFTVTMPKQFDQSKVAAYYGPYGSRSHMNLTFSGDGNISVFGTVQNLKTYQGVTLDMDLPEGYFVGARMGPPYVPILLGLFGGIALLSIVLFLLFGRDGKAVETVEFNAPEGMTPAEVGYIIDGSVDNKDVTSLLIYWADKGYLKLAELEKEDILIQKVKDLPPDAKEFENTMFSALFNGRDSVKVSGLKNTFYATVESAKTQVELAFSARRIFTKISMKMQGFVGFLTALPIVLSFFAAVWQDSGDLITAGIFSFIILWLILAPVYVLINLVRKWRGLEPGKRMLKFFGSLILLGVVFLVYLGAMSLLFDLFLLAAGAIAATLVAAICAMFVRKRTDDGLRLFGQILGLHNFIEKAEKDRIEKLVEQNPNYFYSVLPYAYVLGVTDKWAKRFDEIGLTPPPPVWYNGYYGNNLFTTMLFMNMLNNSMYSINSNFVSRPAPKGGYGGGGGFGGGGFSGGGFGGGGGGGW